SIAHALVALLLIDYRTSRSSELHLEILLSRNFCSFYQRGNQSGFGRVPGRLAFASCTVTRLIYLI
ncbi:MAG: hypothetical protein AB8B49_00955, partial [Nitratireductor sp.]